MIVYQYLGALSVGLSLWWIDAVDLPLELTVVFRGHSDSFKTRQHALIFQPA